MQPVNIKINVRCANSAFQDNPDQLADILVELANRLRGTTPEIGDLKLLRDDNGNSVGTYQVYKD